MNGPSKTPANMAAAEVRRLKELNATFVAALAQVSFYAAVNHGTKSRDYGEVVNPVLRAAGFRTGELITESAAAARMQS